MDLSIKLSFAGGHSWDFVCDEDNPLVAGVVSALPGAMVDQNLPPDGLIQVENRGGERLFFSRSSLVSVAIQRLPPKEASPAPATPLGDEGAFLLLPRAFGASTIEGLLTLPEFQAGGMARQDAPFDLPSLPDAAVDILVAAAAGSASALGVETDQPTQLDVQGVSTAGSALPQRSGCLLSMLAVLAAPGGVAVADADSGEGRAGSAGPSRRVLHLLEGDLLMISPAAGELTVRPNGEGTVALLSASLHLGSGSGGE